MYYKSCLELLAGYINSSGSESDEDWSHPSGEKENKFSAGMILYTFIIS